MALRRKMAAAVRRLDANLRRWTGRRRVFVYVRNAMHVGVLEPVTRALERDPRVSVTFIPETAGKRAHINRASGRSRRWASARSVRGRRVDLLITADPWNPPVMVPVLPADELFSRRGR